MGAASLTTELARLRRGLALAAWGYVFLFFDLKIGSVSLTPRFAGFLLLTAAIGDLAGERRDLSLLRPLCILLAAWAGADWALSWVGEDLNGLVPPLELIVWTAELYCHFQFLTDMAALAQRLRPASPIPACLRLSRTAYVLLCTATALVDTLMTGPLRETSFYVTFVLALAGLAAALTVAVCLIALRVSVGKATDEEF